MLSYYALTSYNSQGFVFWGTEKDASRYADYLNRHRTINLFGAQIIPQDEWHELEGRDDILSGEEPGWDDFMSTDGAA